MEIEYNNLSALNWMWLVAALAIIASMAVAWRRRALGDYLTMAGADKRAKTDARG